MQLNILVLSFVVSGGVTAAVAFAAWQRRRMVGARSLALLMFAIAWWLVTNALEAASLDRGAKIAWSVIAYPGIEAVPVLYLAFVLEWTRQGAWLTRTRVALLLLVPAISVVMAATNGWHGWLWPTVTLIDAWGVTAVYGHGPWFWVEAAYAYSLVAAGLAALVIAIPRHPTVYSTRMRIVIAASLVPLVTSVLYAAGLDATVHADMSSIAFAIAGLIAAWAVLRLRLLDIVPVAWFTVVSSLTDAVLVLDPERRIAALNPSATRLLGIGDEAVGQSIDVVLRQFPQLLALCHGMVDRDEEIPIGPGGPDPADGGAASPGAPAMPSSSTRWLDARLTAITAEQGPDAGCLVVLRDVTERRQMVETIHRLSVTDDLTGLLNRRGFTTFAEQQIRTSIRTRNRLWLLFADLDGLKEINDRLGHEAGDRALCEIARILRSGTFREADLVARLGGDEFAILATEISRADGDAVMRRVEDAVRRVNEAPGREFLLSVSTGVAWFEPERPQTLDELIGEADRRMYHAKQSLRGAARPGDD